MCPLKIGMTACVAVAECTVNRHYNWIQPCLSSSYQSNTHTHLKHILTFKGKFDREIDYLLQLEINNYKDPRLGMLIPIFSTIFSWATAASRREKRCAISISVLAKGIALSKSSTPLFKLPLKLKSIAVKHKVMKNKYLL